MYYRGRFAPSPTGALHGGSLVAALGSWLRARQAGGRWLVRMDDIDPPRVVPGSAASILDTLHVHGLVPDEAVLYQSARETAYRAAFEHLRAQGDVFACWCSRNDLSVHGGVHRDGQCVAPAKHGRRPAWRLRVPQVTVRFDDGLQGMQEQDLQAEVGDFVLLRADGCWSYHLACVVDDAFQGITEVVRGCDLLDSTPRQIYLQQRLGLPTPRYLHLPLVLRAEGGGKLSKSTRDLPLQADTPMHNLRLALQALGLPDAHGCDCGAILTQAITGFDVLVMRHRQAMAWPADTSRPGRM